jgi:acid phosphatase (class A)
MKIFKKFLLFLFIIGNSQFYAQDKFPALTPAEFHYADLIKYSSFSNPDRKWLDTITYPKELFNRAILYTLIQPTYLSDTQVGRLKNYVNFPANSSDQTRKELDFLLDLQKKRSAEQVREVTKLGHVGYWPEIDLLPSHPQYRKNLEDLFYEVNQIMGEEFNAENSPYTLKLLKGIMNDMRLMEFSVKYHRLRARPYQLEPRLQPLSKIKSPSFASGHTLWAYLQAFALSELIPAKRNEFLTLAYEIGLSREIMGVHYPSDEEASRKLAHEMINLMWQNEDFQRDLQNARQEWAQRI